MKWLVRGPLPGELKILKVDRAYRVIAEEEWEWERKKLERATRQARTVLDAACFVLPRKITDECIGDTVEALERAAKEGAHPWKLQAKALICVFWAVLFTLRELAKPAALLAALWRLLFG